MNSNWFDWLARDVARGMPRRDAIRVMAGSAVLAFFGSSARPDGIRGSANTQDPDCDGIRTFYRPDCPNPVPKRNYTPSVNGCGPEGGVFGTGINAVPNSPLAVANFTSACNEHDKGYGTCNRPKETTDQQFLFDMVSACTASYGGSGVFNSIGLLSCFSAAKTYYDAVSKLGDAAYKAGQAAACDCCECKGAGGQCMNPPQYRILKERVVVFCKFLKANPNYQPTQPLKIPGASAGNIYTFTAPEMNALMPHCVALNALIDQLQK